MAHGSVLYVPRCPLFVRSMKTVCCCWVCESGRRGKGEGRRCRKLGQRPPPWPWRFGIVCLTSSVFLFLSTADCGRLSPSQARTPDVKHPVHLPDCPRPPSLPLPPSSLPSLGLDHARRCVPACVGVRWWQTVPGLSGGPEGGRAAPVGICHGTPPAALAAVRRQHQMHDTHAHPHTRVTHTHTNYQGYGD